MARHIGIVGVSAEGAALCYRTICLEGARLMGPYMHPEISMHTIALGHYVTCLNRRDLQGVADLMLISAQKLRDAGADILICPDNTVHQAMNKVTPLSPLPWLHIAEVIAADAKRRGFRRLALTGTQWLVESDVYPGKLAAVGIECVRPSPEEISRIGEIIMGELVCGVFRPKSLAFFQKTLHRLKSEGCDGVIMGCTEIPLILNDDNSPLPTLDSTRLLARAALAVGGGAKVPHRL